MKSVFNEINIGAEKPFEILHISDIHFTYADKRDDRRKNKLSGHRAKNFPEAKSVMDRAVEISDKENIPIMCTGDLIDFVSLKNLDAVREYTSSSDIFMSAGNHEFSLYVGEAWEDEAYRNQSLARVQAAFTNDIRFSSRIINGVNFVAVDNSYYMFEKAQLDALKKEASKKLPIVLMMHVPLYAEDIFDYKMNVLGHDDAALMNVPSELMKNYSEHRFRQQNADEITKEAYDYIISEPMIKLLLTGHIHFDYESKVTDSLTQLINGTDTLRKIRFT